ncbi:MAG: MmgE/PrpD family protein [Betaproteobacteria bacterium]|nr:MmgE/PrpD family protein [Betaproteobacteria bacterium]
MDRTAEQIVQFATALKFEDLSEDTIHQAKARVIDSIGAAMAAHEAPPVRIARSVAYPVNGAAGARLWGTLVLTAPDAAAFVNGVMVRYLDINDAYRTRDAAHPSDNLPGLMAVAETFGLNGRDLILGLAISYEIQCRFTDFVPFNDNGWDQPVSGAPACALATGRMLGLTREQLRNALALAVVPNLCTYQTRAGELSMRKGCAGPNGARQGVFAALLARGGMTGPEYPFEGVFGVWKQTLGKAYDINLPTDMKGHAFALRQSNIKKHPVRDSCQLPIDTALDLRRKIRAEEVASLKIETYKSAYVGAVQDRELWAPQTRETADHSMPFTAIVALIDGEVTPGTFQRERFRGEDVLDLIRRTSIEINDDFAKQTPAVRNCRITATAKDGKTAVAHRTLTLAEIERGFSDTEVEEKFHRLARDTLSEAQRGKLLELAWRLETLSRIEPIIDLLAVNDGAAKNEARA